MEWNLTTFGATVAIGAFLLGSVAVLLSLFAGSPRQLLDSPRRLFGQTSPIAHGLTIVVATFGLGLLFEDLSNKFVDDVDWLSDTLLPTEGAQRSRALLGGNFEELCPQRDDSRSFGPLVVELAERGLLSHHAGANGPILESAILERRCPPDMDASTVERTVSALYYEAKSAVYREADYFQELSQIQTRIDFARSIAILSALLGGLVIILGLAAASSRLSRAARLVLAALLLLVVGVLAAAAYVRHSTWLGWSAAATAVLGIACGKAWPTLASIPDSRSRRFLAALLGFAGTYLLGRFAFASEEIEFDKRAFGYFSSLHATNRRPQAQEIPGYSGMAPLDSRTYVVVHDRKLTEAGNRVGVVVARSDGTVEYQPVAMNWRAFGWSSDLESVCVIPGSRAEILLVESGTYGSRLGRMYRVRLVQTLTDWSGEVMAAADMPAALQDVEGAACIASGGGVLLLLAQRGDLPFEPGRIQWGFLDVPRAVFKFSGEVEIPSDCEEKACSPFNRVATDLWVRGNGELWSAATSDANRPGQAFRSAVFRIGRVDPEASPPVQLLPRPELEHRIDGFKVEAIGPAPNGRKGISIGTDDEEWGGVWRTLEPNADE